VIGHVLVRGVPENIPRLTQRPTGNTDLHLSVQGGRQSCHDGGLEVTWSDETSSFRPLIGSRVPLEIGHVPVRNVPHLW
jgi:hypothetical protein